MNNYISQYYSEPSSGKKNIDNMNTLHVFYAQSAIKKKKQTKVLAPSSEDCVMESIRYRSHLLSHSTHRSLMALSQCIVPARLNSTYFWYQ